jgi:phosphoglycerol transferase MdoB-like AlkP superfamily enzyme
MKTNSSQKTHAAKPFPPRHRGVFIFYGIYLVTCFLTRLLLSIKAHRDLTFDGSFFAAYLGGFIFDCIVASIIAVPLVLYLAFLPQRWFQSRVNHWIIYSCSFAAIYLFGFGIVSEYLFWDEFGVRFNFIAVDYLVYTTEVIRNIQESYNMLLIYFGVFVLSLLLFFLLLKTGLVQGFLQSQSSLRQRWKPALVLLLIPLVCGLGVKQRYLPDFANNFNRELSKNGLFSLFAAFWNNQLDYDQFYLTEPDEKCFADLRENLSEENATFDTASENHMIRTINNSGDEHRWNVIQITVESLSGEYLAAWGNTQNLTPNLDALIQESLFFRNLYATGTRTVRGMEALMLSIPPTPGRSIVKRPDNGNLFNLGTPFRLRGYERTFLYGGNGFFDNMNQFFEGNGFRIIDEPKVEKTAVTFDNAWGACDEDLLAWSMKEADRCFSEKKPFYQFIMTTSNHRPYTYPEGKIDIPSGTGREGAVKYTDYAIGEFIREASSKPWFENTLFVIVADHCAGSARKQALEVKKYEIPLIIYAPKLLQPKVVNTLCSQIDVAPTLFGLLNWSYRSKFYGRDILALDAAGGRALIGNYQKLGVLKEDSLSILKPVKKFSMFQVDRKNGNLTEIAPTEAGLSEALSYYQSAAHLFDAGELEDFE